MSENTLILDTTKGEVTIEMRPDLAPNHVSRIKQLVREGFYDGLVFHRVIEDFMAQTGCPQGTGNPSYALSATLDRWFSRRPFARARRPCYC